jgi:hypothetical protein
MSQQSRSKDLLIVHGPLNEVEAQQTLRALEDRDYFGYLLPLCRVPDQPWSDTMHEHIEDFRRLALDTHDSKVLNKPTIIFANYPFEHVGSEQRLDAATSGSLYIAEAALALNPAHELPVYTTYLPEGLEAEAMIRDPHVLATVSTLRALGATQLNLDTM